MMRLLFASTSAIALPTLRALAQQHHLIGVITQPDRPAGRRRLLQASPIKQTCQAELPQIPLFQPEKLRDPLLYQKLRELDPEILITFSYGKIIPKELLELPSRTSLNIHPSLLPKYRGPSPIQTAILEGEQTTGITIMYMDEGLDTGALLLQQSFPILPNESAGALSDRLAEAIPATLLESLALLEQEKAPIIPQQEEKATHTTLLSRESAHLDWHQPATTLARLVRAMNPTPGAHGELILTRKEKEEKLPIKLFEVIGKEKPTTQPDEEISGRNYLPGSFFLSHNQKPMIACGPQGQESLQITEIQPVGKQKMSGKGFLQGYRDYAR